MQATFEKLEALNSDKVSYAEVKAFFTEVITMIVENERKVVADIMGIPARTDEMRQALVSLSLATQRTSHAWEAALEELDGGQESVKNAVEFFTRLINMLIHNEREVLLPILTHPNTDRRIRRSARRWGKLIEDDVPNVINRHFNDHQSVSATVVDSQ